MQVVVVTPRISVSSLRFTASYQTGNSNDQRATCSPLTDIHAQKNCTAEFAFDIIPPVNSINLTVIISELYGSTSLLKDIDLRKLVILLDNTFTYVYAYIFAYILIHTYQCAVQLCIFMLYICVCVCNFAWYQRNHRDTIMM